MLYLSKKNAERGKTLKQQQKIKTIFSFAGPWCSALPPPWPRFSDTGSGILLVFAAGAQTPTRRRRRRPPSHHAHTRRHGGKPRTTSPSSLPALSSDGFAMRPPPSASSLAREGEGKSARDANRESWALVGGTWHARSFLPPRWPLRSSHPPSPSPSSER
jgi:hypothetical protein